MIKALARRWVKLGVVLQKITSPVLLRVIYFGIVTPWSLIYRLFNRDPLRMRHKNPKLDDEPRIFGADVFSKPF